MRVTRAEVVREALTWVGTPFHDRVGLKGVGCDCAYLLVRVFSAVGLIENFDPEYKPQFFQHRNEPLFLQTIERCGGRRIALSETQSADIFVYNYGRQAAHGAIVIDSNTIVHAYNLVGCVTQGNPREFAHRLDSAWSIFK